MSVSILGCITAVLSLFFKRTLALSSFASVSYRAVRCHGFMHCRTCGINRRSLACFSRTSSEGRLLRTRWYNSSPTIIEHMLSMDFAGVLARNSRTYTGPELVSCGNGTNNCCLDGEKCGSNLLFAGTGGNVARQYCSDIGSQNCSTLCPGISHLFFIN